jgi:predicted Mrr-cat superfamily restriction endonuclease
MPKVWKIAPGSNAHAWPECQEGHCILIGWRELGDHSRFQDELEVRKAMKKAYKRGEPGTGPGAARSVWRFAKHVQPTDIVVANTGRSSAVGIGVVETGYLPPGAPDNPSKHEWLHSARLVDWRITDLGPAGEPRLPPLRQAERQHQRRPGA